MRSHGLSLSEFTTEYTEKEKARLILIEVFKPGTRELIGFIRFAYDREGLSIGGGLKIANFNASLQGHLLRTGETTKSKDAGQTGQFGEGMKLSALVFRRAGYKYCIESTGFRWDFIYQKRELACKVLRIPDKRLRKMQKNAGNGPRIAASHPWEDVCVIIGAPGRTHNIRGDPLKGERIHVDDFKKWLKVTLDINPPQKVIRTSKGYLIRDPTNQGLLYLQGLLFLRGGTCLNLYQYSYNFLTGNMTRDRTSLSGAGEESTRVAEIWAAAIREADSEDSGLLAEYTQLILKSLNKVGDVTLDTLQDDVAHKVWAQLLRINHDQDGRKPFYYVANGKDVCIGAVSEDLILTSSNRKYRSSREV
jgi:hypothetical protein